MNSNAITDLVPALKVARLVRERDQRVVLGRSPQLTMSGFPSLQASVGVGGLLFLVAIHGLCGYVIGKVLAPSDAKAKRYGLIGIPVALLGGLPGLAVFAAVASPR